MPAGADTTKKILIGTAGHVDHGKTALIRAMTGVDTDRLPEEKQRGMTVDLGFAGLDLPGGIHADFVDVPGHARYLQNMLAGVFGLDAVLMVVAADEGVMPQTMEHLAALDFSGVSRGMILLTKADLVDAQRLDEVRGQVQRAFAGSFLEKAEILPVSARTGEGIAECLRSLALLAGDIPPRQAGKRFWMPVDRVFTVEGFGTVVTGPVLDGSIRSGMQVWVWPQGIPAKVRGLQAGGHPAGQIDAGQRAAVNLAGLPREGIGRGCVLSTAKMGGQAGRVNVWLRTLPGARTLRHGSRLHLSVGTAHLLCRLCTPGRRELQPGESAFAQLRLEGMAAVRPGDRFVLRFYSPLETVAGGCVLDTCPTGKWGEDTFAFLEDARQMGDTAQILHAAGKPVTLAGLKERLWWRTEKWAADTCSMLLAEGRLVKAGDYLLRAGMAAPLLEEISRQLEAYQQAHPYENGMPVAQIAGICPPDTAGWLCRMGQALDCRDGRIFPKGQKTPQAPRIQKIADTACRMAAESGCLPVKLAEMLAGEGVSPREGKAALRMLEQAGRLTALPDGYYLAAADWLRAKELVKTEIRQAGSITLARFRDLAGISRKPAQMLLEQMDRDGYTVRTGETRILGRE